jgi:muramidase (phage lysozyme)
VTPSPSLKYFLDLIAWSEGTSTSPITQNKGYDVIVTGIHGPSIFTDYSDHPFAHGGKVQWRLDPPSYSTAAGRYQLLARYWKSYRIQLALSDYSPASQDAVALQQMKQRGAVDKVLAGDIAGAVGACSNIWASFPGNTYGQGSHRMDSLLNQYTKLSKE